MPRRLPIARLAALWLGLASVASAQVGPAESAKKVKPAAGLEAKLWAAEPMVINPTSLDIDSRGRVWVDEGLNYRLSRGRNNRFSKIDEADKIKILEDTDGDGTADKVTVFADQIFPVPMGLAVEEHYDEAGKYTGCKVYVGNSPNLLVLEDTDGDDKADARYPLLTGFGGIDSDHGVHGTTLFLDGKLYFTHGDGCCSVQPDKSERTQNFDVTDASGRHVSSDQLANTLRVDRDGKNFEILADRQRNNYETSLNSFGNIFTSDNDDDGNRGSRVIWVMEGGKYGYRTPGSPRHWGEEVPGNVPKLVGTGNGSPCGIQVYEGALLPKEYFGGLFESDAGTRQVNFFPITRSGAAFRTEYKVLLGSDDPWFRPVDTASAPDGSVFVADWYDAGVGGHAFSDQTTGRIYRVAPASSKTEKPKYDFATIEGLVAALQSPVTATQDAARRGLQARGDEAAKALMRLVHEADDPVFAARAMWVAAGMGDSALIGPLTERMRTNPEVVQTFPAPIRELAVRILGRDVSRTGQVELAADMKPLPLSAEKHLDVLLPLASDPDAGVRRELILAFRDMPTERVGEALRKLAASWDGQDRWYLEALGLALRDREPEFLTTLFDGTLYGSLDDALFTTSGVSLPPYFPTDRNEAFLSASDPAPAPANALTKTLGLLWQIHRTEGLPLLARLLPHLDTPDLRQAADDVLEQVSDPAGAVTIAELVFQSKDPIRQGQALRLLARRLGRDWKEAVGHPRVAGAIDSALRLPAIQADGLLAASATGDLRYADRILTILNDADAPIELRAAAVEAIGRLKPPQGRALLDAIIEQARKEKTSDPVSEAALRTLPQFGLDRSRLVEFLSDADLPLGLRREALRTVAQNGDSARAILGLARAEKLPADLKAAASALLNAHPDRNLRNEAAEVLPLSATAGRPLPSFDDLVNRQGDAEKGRAAFFSTGTNACSSCHRVQGRGQWVGPDLSTIGTKYGKDGLLTSILSPGAAIGYNFRSYVVALTDGRLLTGLPVEEAPDRLVLKTADGQRVEIEPSTIEEKRISEVSLMPDGLAQAMTDDDLVHLLAYLTTLRQPVSIVGEFHALGPVDEPSDRPVVDFTGPIDPAQPIPAAGGWRRLRADAEGRVVASSAREEGKATYLLSPLNVPSDLEATFVLQTSTPVAAWLDGVPLELVADPSAPGTLAVPLRLSRGHHQLLLRSSSTDDLSVIATFVSDQPLSFQPPAGP
jgi:putative membrane-bound dehydrogenase-like protein